jgi:hypothetical protein
LNSLAFSLHFFRHFEIISGFDDDDDDDGDGDGDMHHDNNIKVELS